MFYFWPPRANVAHYQGQQRPSQILIKQPRGKKMVHMASLSRSVQLIGALQNHIFWFNKNEDLKIIQKMEKK